jgi:AraC-like DNA-binding protein
MPRRKIEPPRGVLKQTTEQGQSFFHARYHPSPDLEPFLEHLWSVAWDCPPDRPARVETLPHPTVHLIFENGVGGRIGGVARGKFSTLLQGQGRIIAAKFRPGGFFPFVRCPVSQFSGKILDVGEYWGREGAAVTKAVLAEPDDDARHRLVEEFLRNRQPVIDDAARRTGLMAEAIATDRSLTSVEELCRRNDLNVRALQRLFARYIGVNPKWVIQRYRLHEAAEQLARRPGNQAVLAAELGYADQAHFVRDFKAVVGISPAAYARRAGGEPAA